MVKSGERTQPPKTYVDGLRNQQVPLAAASLEELCRACDGCGTDVQYPSRFGAEETTEVYGSVKPFGRLVICATGRTDWDHDVASEDGSLAQLLDRARSASNVKSSNGLLSKLKLGGKKAIEGIHQPGDSSKVTILNGSQYSAAHACDHTSLIVLPDWKLITDIPLEPAAAQELFDSQLAGTPSPSSSTRSWPLPYRAVILLCSHRKRDKRCGIAAPLLANEVIRCAEQEGWDVDERGDHEPDSPLQEPPNVVGLFKCSHTGGHKFAGNIIIALPTGAVIWYGLVRPSDIASIVQTTLKDGKVIPELLRGGLGLSRPNSDNLLSW